MASKKFEYKRREPEKTDLHRPRVNLRRPGHDYASTGRYFVTICTHARQPLFGAVVDGEMALNDAGRMVNDVLEGLAGHMPGIVVDAFVVMPDHVHAVIEVAVDMDGAGRESVFAGDECIQSGNEGGECIPNRRPRRAATTDLGEVVRRFKTLVAHLYGIGVAARGWPRYDGHLWQRGFHDHIIRDEAALASMRQYIRENPMRTQEDR